MINDKLVEFFKLEVFLIFIYFIDGSLLLPVETCLHFYRP